MSLPGVIINIENGAIGSVAATGDGVAGMILTGVAVSGKIALNEAKQIFSLKEAEDLGLTADYDTTNSLDVYRQIKSFYNEAQNGKELWIMLVASTVTLADMVDKALADNAVKLLNAADGTIKLLGISRVDAAAATILDGLDADVYAAITNAQTLSEEFAANMKPLRVIVGAREWSGAAADLADLKQRTDNRVAVSLVGHSSGNKNADIGIVLGKLAAIPVQRNIGRVKDGSLSLSSAYFTDGATVESHETEWGSLHDKGFIALRKHIGKAGYYFIDDPVATSATDDYASIARGRVIDKALVLTYNTYIEELNDEVPVNPDGTLSAAYVKSLQGKIENVINQSMTVENEISAVKCTIDETQNIISTNKLVIDLKITPVGYAKEIEINLGFNNPLNNA